MYTGSMQLSATTKPESGGLTADGSTKRVLVAKEEYIRLRWAAAYWKAQHAGAVEREKQLKSENLSLRARVRELESQLWGRKSEQAKGGRAGSSSPKASGRPRGQQKGKRGHGRTTLDGLAAQEEVVDLEEAQKSCPKCGLALGSLGLDGRRRGGRNRSAGSPAGDPAAQVQSGLPLRGAARHCHGARPGTLDSQRQTRDFGLGGDSAGEV